MERDSGAPDAGGRRPPRAPGGPPRVAERAPAAARLLLQVSHASRHRRPARVDYLLRDSARALHVRGPPGHAVVGPVARLALLPPPAPGRGAPKRYTAPGGR